MKKQRIAWWRGLFHLGLCLWGLAAGTAYASSPYNHCTSGQLPLSNSIEVKSSSNLPVGSPIPGSDFNVPLQINCSTASDADTAGCEGGGGWSLTAFATPGETAYANTYTYPGLNEGIGFQALGSDGLPLPAVPGSYNTRFFVLSPGRPVDGTQSVAIRFRLVKIAPTVTEGVASSPAFYLACNGAEYANVNEDNSRFTFTANVTRVASGCVPMASDTVVTLPSLTRSQFSGVGTTAGRTNFMLGFQCDADAHALVTFTDATLPSNSGSIINLSSGASAAGLGVQLISNNAPIVMAPNELSSLGGTALMLDSAAGAGNQVINIPLAAEYIQSAASITPGMVNASVLFNIAYQ
jgi:type 1 fimbria pilin